MRVIICDRCKQEISRPAETGIGQIKIRVFGEKGTMIKDSPYIGWDFCPSCLADIQEYIEAPLKEDDEKPKATIRKRATKADRIKELAAAGMDPKTIASEVSCSIQTVKKHMNSQEGEDDTVDPETDLPA